MLFAPLGAVALGPHEILVLANGSQPDSIEVAKAYARMRQVPAENVVVLNMSAWDPLKSLAISPAEFTRLIWSQAVRTTVSRGVNDHILAWVYSTHFPIRISTQPPVSLQGLTFVRNQMPTSKEIAGGTYVSPLFAGPDGPKANGYGPQTLDTARRLLREEMPLPSITLGYTGPRGNTKAEVLKCLRTGVRSDASQPQGSVYFVTSEDIRSKCRQWQFPTAARGLKSAGVRAVVGDEVFPEDKSDVIGVMMGSASVDPSIVGRFLPGAFAEHLTSAAAAFDSKNQTKLSRWIAHGATASAGAVCEPFSIWAKFPNARIFNHYATGCTLIESFYQSVRCPLQVMFVGEPLAAPWAPSASVALDGIENGELIKEPRTIGRSIVAEPGVYFSRTLYLLDGRMAHEGRAFE
ncbi:MAG: TIGR03790 family protein, partial [Verrucomicrobia bacterium]|nr:TIGR03790 family protein [Verrucomicrobiota bacterium]